MSEFSGIKIFLAYAEVDEVEVRELYFQLKENGYQPWMEAEDIEAGQNRQDAIDNAIGEADLFIACFSSDSVDQSGELMKLLRRGLDLTAEATVGEIYLIPLKFDECEIPNLRENQYGLRLKDYQELDYWLNDGWERLVWAIELKINALESSNRSLSPRSFSTTNSVRFGVPFERNIFFTGRKAILAELHEALSQDGKAAINQVQAISGLGGIGKTQTAVEYAYYYFFIEPVYQRVFWVKADSELNLQEDFGKLTEQLNLRTGRELNQRIEAVKVWLQTHDGWLLIFDNADQPQWLKSFIPPNAQGKILITSRASVFDMVGVIKPLALPLLEKEEAVKFLCDRVEQEPSDAAAELAKTLGYLPLALEQAGAYILRSRITFAVYLEIYAAEKLNLLEEAKPQLGDYPESVLTTWALNFEVVKQRSLAAAELLEFSAFMAADAIPYELLINGASGLEDNPVQETVEEEVTLVKRLFGVFSSSKREPETQEVGNLSNALYQAIANEDRTQASFQLSKLLQILSDYSLIRQQPEIESYSIHRMVQEVLRDGMSQRIRLRWIEKVVDTIAHATPDVGKFENWPWMARLLPHAIQVIHLAKKCQFESKSLAYLLGCVGYYLVDQGRYGEAEPYYQQSLEMYRKLLGDEHPDVATSLNNLAGLYESQGKYEEAEPYYQQSLEMRRKLLGNEHPHVATSLNNLAGLYESQGKYEEAEPYYQQSLEMRRKLLGNEHPSVATSLQGLAVLYKSQGKYEEAEPYYLQSLEMTRKLLGNEHPSVASSLNNLALLYYSQGKYEEAKPYYQQSLEMTRKLLGNEHPDVATSLNNLALLYQSQGKYEEAEPYYQQSLEMYRKLLGDEHPDVATSLNNLAGLYESQGKYEEAEPYYQQSLEMRRKLLGNEHPDVATSLNNLAGLYESQGKYEEAEPYYQQSLEMRRKLLGNEHPDVASSLNNLAYFYSSQGKYEQAIGYYQAAIAVAQKALGENHPNTQLFMTNFFLMLRNAPEAEIFQVLPEAMHAVVRELRQSKQNE